MPIKVWGYISFCLALSNCTYAMPIEKDICEIIQTTINLPKLQQYYHVDIIPERKPLKVVTKLGGKNCINITKFSEPVIILESPPIREKAYLQFNKIKIKGYIVAFQF